MDFDPVSGLPEGADDYRERLDLEPGIGATPVSSLGHAIGTAVAGAFVVEAATTALADLSAPAGGRVLVPPPLRSPPPLERVELHLSGRRGRCFVPGVVGSFRRRSLICDPLGGMSANAWRRPA